MTNSNHDTKALAAELRTETAEPFLPIERRLVITSLVLGFGLLGVLVWVSNALF